MSKANMSAAIATEHSPTRHKRGHGDGGIHQRADGRWEARLDLPDGKRKSYYGKTRLEVRDKLRMAQRKLEEGLDLGTREQSVGQFLDRWLADVAKARVRPSTFDSYALNVRLHLTPGLGHHRLGKLTAQHVQAFLNAKLAAGLAPKTVQYLRGILRTALAQAVKWRLIGVNVATLVDPPRSVHHEIQPLTIEQARRFIDHTKDDRLGPLFHVAIATGLRQGELFGLKWEDVDLERGVLHVRRAMQRVAGEMRFVEPKTGTSRRAVTLIPSAVAALRAQKVRQNAERLGIGSKWQDWGLVFASSVGTPLNTSNVSGRLHKLLAEAGLPRQRFHDLRHCAASLMLAGGVDLRTIKDVLGHSQISLTANLYTHLSPALRQDAADRLAAVLALPDSSASVAS